MKKIVFILVLFVIVLSGCERITEGYIIQKWYEPAETNLVLIPILISNGKTTSTVLMPYTIYDGEDYCIKVIGVTSEGKEKTKKLYLTPDEYDLVSIDDFYVIEKDKDKDFTYREEKR